MGECGDKDGVEEVFHWLLSHVVDAVIEQGRVVEIVGYAESISKTVVRQ